MEQNNVYFTKERREVNMQLVIEKLKNEEQLDFNSLMFAFADIMQSSFLNALMIGKSAEEKDAVNQDLIKMRNGVIDALNANSTNMMYDMVIMTDLIMDAVEHAMQEALKDSQSK